MSWALQRASTLCVAMPGPRQAPRRAMHTLARRSGRGCPAARLLERRCGCVTRASGERLRAPVLRPRRPAGSVSRTRPRPSRPAPPRCSVMRTRRRREKKKERNQANRTPSRAMQLSLTPVLPVFAPRARLAAPRARLAAPRMRRVAVRTHAGLVQQLTGEELEVAIAERTKPLVIDFYARRVCCRRGRRAGRRAGGCFCRGWRLVAARSPHTSYAARAVGADRAC